MVIRKTFSTLSSMAIKKRFPVKTRDPLNHAKIVVLEGNISAGKTFLSAKLGEILNYKVFLEPTTTNPYLQSFYENPKKYALDMQLWLLNQRYKTYLSALEYSLTNDSGVVLDRSVFSDCVFAENCRKEGLISPEGYITYHNTRLKMVDKIPIPNITVYLDVSPEECLNRIQTLRKRDCEQSIPLSYLQGLDEIYNTYIEGMKSNGSHVIKVDWSKFGEIDEIVNQIKANKYTLSPEYLDIIKFDEIKGMDLNKNNLEEIELLNKETSIKTDDVK